MLRLARPLGAQARRQFLSKPHTYQIRGYADRDGGMLSGDPAFKPNVPTGAAGPVTLKTTEPIVTPPPSTSTPTPASPATPTIPKEIPPSNIALTPPPPPDSIVKPVSETGTTRPPPSSASPASSPLTPISSSSPPPPRTQPEPTPAPITPPPPPPRRRRSRFRTLLYLLVLTALGYSGAVFAALQNDNFHDFFTEYVPFGEDIVLYFEERSFHRRFPNARQNAYSGIKSSQDDGKKKIIPFGSGLRSRTVEEHKSSDVTSKGKHMSAMEDPKLPKTDAKQEPSEATTKQASAAVSEVKDSGAAKAGGAKPEAVKSEAAPPPKTPTVSKTSSSSAPTAEASSGPPPSPAAPSPKSDPRPPAIPQVTAISPVTVPNASEPVVQDLVKVLNDLITVINADDAQTSNKYSAPLQKAKDSITQIASQISALRDAERAAAEERIKEAHREFDEGAKKLLERIETVQREEDIRYREEFEQERNKIQQQYESRLKTELDRAQQVADQKLQNELIEQAIQMKRKFIQDVQNLVESERNGRLSKLTELTDNVDKLTQLTSNWNGIIDSNLATQKLQVAVDAVRSALDDSNSEHKPKPFVREMAALKLTADSDPVVDAAVATIRPAAYQKGIPSTAQLIDRFRRVASEVRKASLLPENAGVASHAASVLLSKVMFKKQGIPDGNDVESVLTRTETLLEEGNLDDAAREMNELQGWAGVLSKDWLEDARKVLEVKQALDVIEAEARLQCLRVE